MSTTTTHIAIDVPAEGENTKILTQYGCLQPDGSIKWDRDDHRGRVYVYEGIAAKEDRFADWQRMLFARAKNANLPGQAYVDQHQLVKRNVIVVTTKPENITGPGQEDPRG